MVTHQVPLEEEEGVSAWLRRCGIVASGWQRKVQNPQRGSGLPQWGPQNLKSRQPWGKGYVAAGLTAEGVCGQRASPPTPAPLKISRAGHMGHGSGSNGGTGPS